MTWEPLGHVCESGGEVAARGSVLVERKKARWSKSTIRACVFERLRDVLFKILPAATYSPTHLRMQYIGGGRLNFRVRNGNGCDPAPMTTGKLAVRGPASLD